MFIELHQPLKPGDTVPVTFKFKKAPDLTVTFPVKALIDEEDGEP